MAYNYRPGIDQTFKVAQGHGGHCRPLGESMPVQPDEKVVRSGLPTLLAAERWAQRANDQMLARDGDQE